MNDLRTRVTDFARSLNWHRRILAAGLAAAGTAVAIEAASPGPPETATVVVVAETVNGGTVLESEHLDTAEVPPGAVPDGMLTHAEAVGRTLAGPANAGEIITDTRVVGEGLLAGWDADLVGVPVRLADAGATGLLRRGDRIDVLAARADGSGATQVVAEAVPVLTVTEKESDPISSGGGLLIVAATVDQASSIAGAAAISQLSFTLRPPAS